MRTKSNVNAGGISMQHNQRISRSLKIKTGVKAGTDFHFIMKNN